MRSVRVAFISPRQIKVRQQGLDKILPRLIEPPLAIYSELKITSIDMTGSRGASGHLGVAVL